MKAEEWKCVEERLKVKQGERERWEGEREKEGEERRVREHETGKERGRA